MNTPLLAFPLGLLLASPFTVGGTGRVDRVVELTDVEPAPLRGPSRRLDSRPGQVVAVEERTPRDDLSDVEKCR
jgi:hypothetical protein